MITANDLKTKYQVLTVCKMVNDKITARWEADLDNEELERFSDVTDARMWDAADSLAAALEEFTGGRIDFATARKMAVNPRYSGRLDDLMSRLTA